MTQAATFYDLIGFSAPPCDASDTPYDVPDLSRSALFLDFDGTLVEFADRPDAIHVPDELNELLSRLYACTGGAMAVVSGRSLEELEARLPEYHGIIVGSHGAEQRGDRADSDSRRPEKGNSGRVDPAFRNARDMLRAWARNNPDILFEEKPTSLVLHYRQAPDRETDCINAMTVLADSMSGYEMRLTRMAVELLPEHVSEKAAVVALMKRWPERMPIAVGDDSIDEGMFHAVDAMGGYGIKVGEGWTVAACRIGDVHHLRALLRFWLDNPVGAPCQSL